MALQVWLPLNGSLENKGLNQKITLTNNGATVDNNGKIGKCYTYTTSQYMEINNLQFSSLSSCSISFWIKVTAKSSSGWLPFTGQTTSYYIMATSAGTGAFYHGSAGSGQKIYKDGIISTTPGALNEWHHYVITGINLSSWTKFYINKYSSAWNFGGSVNDLRIYDHCLSPKEVKEISKGLVLHYKLDDIGINNNLLPIGSQRLSVNGSKSSNEYMNLCSTLNIFDTYGLVPYTISFDIKADVAHSFNIYGNYGSNPKYSFSQKSINVTTEWQRFSHTFTPYISTSSGTWAGISVYGVYGSGAIVSVRNVKLELGTKSTPISQISNKIYDCSGYGNNGSILESLNLNNDKPRYNYSTNFDGNTSGILIENLNISNIINTAMTYSFWIKPNGENGARSVYFGSYSGSSFSIEKTTGNKLRLYWNGSPDLTSNLTITDGQWQHIVITKNGTSEIKVYLNGSLVQTLSNTYNNVTFPTTFRIGRDTRTGTTSYKGLMSDFRIYSTVLSANDILELYNNPANIDNQGDMFSFEFDEENTSKQQILQIGITKIDNYIEINDKIKVLSDGSVFLQILHHNNPTSNLFTVSNCWLNNTTNLYSATILLKTIFKNLTEYEFLVCEKLTSSSSESQVRWKQTSNPALSSTLSGYTLISGSTTSNGGLMNKGTYGCFHNGNTWWNCCGSYTAYSGGIPGFTGIVKSGYLDLYIRIPEDVLKGNIEDFLKFFKKSILSTQFLEK